MFRTLEAQQQARQRLHMLQVAGHYLQVEMVGGHDEAATTSRATRPATAATCSTVSLPMQPPLPSGLPPPRPQPLVPQLFYSPAAPLAPHLG